MPELMEHQEIASEQLDSGNILWGGVGTGKSRTVLAYYMKKEAPRNIIVITTAKKRDSLDWLSEAQLFGISTDPDKSCYGTITVDSWNNINNYVSDNKDDYQYEDCFFIFDEQRLVGNGAWVKSFIKIARKNRWVMLSATPGDTWLDYAPVFIANGFFKNITEFKHKHVIYEPFSRYPKIKGYTNERKLMNMREHILVEMPYLTHTERHVNIIPVGHDAKKLKRVNVDRWNIFEDKPIVDAAEMWRVMRRLMYTHPSRLDNVRFLMKAHPRLIIFYNFNYELEILRTLGDSIPVYEFNGHRHDPIPETDRWVYLVQYVAGAEAWNCTTTDAMILYSLTYSYKVFMQAQGRIDRLDTKYVDLYYYIFMSNSIVDKGVMGALDTKKNFNEKKYVREMEEYDGGSAEEEMRIELACHI